jgi:hypothetical protein
MAAASLGRFGLRKAASQTSVVEVASDWRAAIEVFVDAEQGKAGASRARKECRAGKAPNKESKME